MSTRSLIGIIHSDRSITAVYCHSDGYPTYNGRLLTDHWANTKKVRSLMGLGMLSTLGEILGKKHDINWSSEDQFSYDRAQKALAGMTAEERAEFDDNPFSLARHWRTQDPRYRYTKSYRRDRGDKDVNAYQMSAWNDQHAEEYVYLWCEVREFWLIGLWGEEAQATSWRKLADVRALTDDQQNAQGQGIPLGLTPQVDFYAPSRDFEMLEAAQEAIALF